MVYLKFSAPPIENLAFEICYNLLFDIYQNLLFDQSIKLTYQFIEMDYPIYGRFVHGLLASRRGMADALTPASGCVQSERRACLRVDERH